MHILRSRPRKDRRGLLERLVSRLFFRVRVMQSEFATSPRPASFSYKTMETRNEQRIRTGRTQQVR
jgi:hypothetical protein